MSLATQLVPRRRRPGGLTVGYYALAGVLAVAFVFPIFWSVLNAFKPPAEAAASPPTLLPSRPDIQSFSNVFAYGSGVGQAALNSFATAAMTIAGTLVLSVLAGYGFARFSFPGKTVIFVVILTTLMIPFQSILTPLFLLLRALNLNNSLLGLALIYITFQLPFSTFMMKNSFESVPREIEEAALIDGCSPISLLTRVMLPLVAPGIVTVAVFAFLGSWNEFIAALIFISDNERYTLPVTLMNTQSGVYGTVNWGTVQAALSIAMLPSVILFIALQRHYISGLTNGAVK